MAEDYYQTLGVGRDAAPAEIQKAYRDMARKYHPDVNPDKSAKQKFQEVQKAFDVLNDAKKREMYDRYGSSFEEAAAGPRGGHTYSGGPGGGFEGFDFSQIFGDQGGGGPTGGFADFFSQLRRGAVQDGPRQQRAGGRRRGGDLRHEIEVPFATAITGGEVELQVERPSGKTDTIRAKIPVGIEDGKDIRLRGQGDDGQTGQPGDLLVTVHVAPHPWFQRRGDNLYVKVPVTLAEAAAGAKVDVPTPYGTVALRVPPCTSSGTKLRIRGQGVQAKGRPAGDLFAEIQIVLPKKIDDETLAAIKKLDGRERLDPRRELKW